jgi:hypothetical protein
VIAIYTACIGGRDTPRPQVAQDIDVTWLYHTDRDIEVPEPWTRIRGDVPDGEHPNLSAKRFKTHPPLVETAIWIDASMEITSPRFAREAIAALDGAPVATWKHPRRTSILAEVDASLGREGQDGRYACLPLRAQAQSYLDEGYPDDALYACGTIVWTPAARAMAHDWWNECIEWGYQDQISFPVCAWRAGIKPATFPIPQIERRLQTSHYLANRWLRIWPHTPGTD